MLYRGTGPAFILAGVVALGCTQIVAPGRATYEAECIMCHGASGKGDSDFAQRLMKEPADLTVLALDNGGVFPRLRVAAVIDGSGRGAHFSGAMPTFALNDTAGPTGTAQDRVGPLLDYLETLQVLAEVRPAE